MPLVTLVQATVISGRAFDIDDVILNTRACLELKSPAPGAGDAAGR